MKLVFTPEAVEQLEALTSNRGLTKRLKAVRKTLGWMEKGANGEKVFEAYAENKTPAAYRVFWHYGPGKDAITVVAITPHP